MCFLVRKYLRAKWEQSDRPTVRKRDFKSLCYRFASLFKSFDSESINADAITLCLKTTSNELSTWRTPDNSRDNVENAILAIITGPEQKSLESIDIVCLRESDIRQCGLVIDNTPDQANTVVESMKNDHYSIKHLNYKTLGRVAFLIRRYISMYSKHDQSQGDISSVFVKRYTRSELKTILRRAVERKVLAMDDLPEPLRKSI